MPVQWWYNWGNGIPDPAAQAVTAVTFILSRKLIEIIYEALQMPAVYS